jgi:hypothetical protein
MGRFLVALLDREGRQAVITPAMHDDLYRVHHEDAPYGAAHGLVFDLLRLPSGVRAHHGGESAGYSCYLALAPSDGMGLFYCYTGVKPLRFTPAEKWPPDRWAVREALSKPLGFGDSRGADEHAANWRDSWNEYLGSYLSVFRHHHGVGRLRSMIHPRVLRVERGTRGLLIDGIDGLDEIAPGAFGAPGLGDSFAFYREPRTGRLVLSRAAGFSAYEKPSLRDDPRLIVPLLTALLVLAASGLAFPVWRLKGHALARSAALGFAVTAIGSVGVLFGAHAFGDPYAQGIAWPILCVRAGAFLVIPLAVLLALALSRLRRHDLRGRARLARVHLIALFVAAWVAIPVLIDVGLIGVSPLR